MVITRIALPPSAANSSCPPDLLACDRFAQPGLRNLDWVEESDDIWHRTYQLREGLTVSTRRRPQRGSGAPPRREELVQGNDDLDVGDGVAVQLVDGLGGLRPVAFDRMSPGLRSLAGQMIQNIGAQRSLVTDLDEMVGHARAHGMSWGSIGWCTGISAQAAQKRWGDPS